METNLYPDAPHNNNLQVGAEFVDFVMETLLKKGIVLQAYTSKKKQYDVGESLQGWEIKLDNPFTNTGRLSIEIAEKTARDNSDWIPSGIYRNDNTWIYIQGNYQRFYWFQKNILQILHRTGRYEEDQYNGTIKKYYLPIEAANRYGKLFIP